jgi:hypothetical protein
MSAPAVKSALYQGNSLIITQTPTKFGGQQKSYLEMSNSTIQKAVAEIKSSLTKKDVDVKKIFFECFDSFRAARVKIAKQHNTSDFEQFGRMRTDDKAASTTYTTLCRPYDKYGNTIKLSMLSTFIPDLIKGKKVQKGDQNSQIHGRIFNIPNPSECSPLLSQPKTEEEAREKMQKMKTTDPINFQKIYDLAASAQYQANLTKIKVPIDLFNLPKDSEIRMAAAAIHMRVGEALIQIGEYFMLHNAKIPLAYSVKNVTELMPFVQFNHMNRDDIKTCLQDIAGIFERIIKKEKPDPASLKKDLAEFRYKFAYCMPCERGSAAIGEWFEATMAALHGFKIISSEDVLLDCEAFATPYFPNFIKKYETLVQLEPIEKS